MKHLTLPNDIEEITQLNDSVIEYCEGQGIDMDVAMNLTLAIEETVVNVMSYAYPEGTVGHVDIDMDVDAENITFVISDKGKPFDPTQKEAPDITLPAEDRPIGGLGIHLVRQIMDSVTYEYAGDKNILTLKKKLNK